MQDERTIQDKFNNIPFRTRSTRPQSTRIQTDKALFACQHPYTNGQYNSRYQCEGIICIAHIPQMASIEFTVSVEGIICIAHIPQMASTRVSARRHYLHRIVTIVVSDPDTNEAISGGILVNPIVASQLSEGIICITQRMHHVQMYIIYINK